MKAEFLHVGIPVPKKDENMTYNQRMDLWKNNDVDIYDFHIEYLRFGEDNPFPECLHKYPHVAFKVDNMEEAIAECDRAVWGPVELRPGFKMAFTELHNTYFELLEIK